MRQEQEAAAETGMGSRQRAWGCWMLSGLGSSIQQVCVGARNKAGELGPGCWVRSTGISLSAGG